jgi:hydrogenase nickel incorporation protein HypA/HybF
LHELDITESLLRVALEQAGASRVRRIVSIKLKIGELTGYAPEAVEHNFGQLSAGTIAEGAALVIERVPLRCHCKACGSVYRAARDDFSCPACRVADFEITGGREMFIESMEVQS